MKEKITINEHSSIRISAEKTIYFDPFRIPEERHDADIIFFTHSHYDHFSPEDFMKLSREETVFVMPVTMCEEALQAKLEHIVFLQPGETKNVLGIPVEAIASYNIGKPMHPRENAWLGYVITLEEKHIYVCGDCDATPEGKTVTCDIALVPIGGTYTMNAEEAAEFVNQMKPKAVIPTHYGTLVGKAEDIKEFQPLVHSNIPVWEKILLP